MLEGCLLGKISSEGTDTNYLYGITQPIYFIADSSADSGVVKIRVGLIDSNTTGNKSNKGKITTEAGEYCFLNAFESVIYKDAEVFVGGECDFENCFDDYDDIQIQLIRQLNNFEFREGEYISVCVCDTCTDEEYPTGQSTPVPFYDRKRKNVNGEWTNMWNLIACNNSEDKIEVRPVAIDINFPIPIYVDFIADVCYNLISNFSDVLINDTTELKDKNKIPNSELEDLVHDICGHFCYPNVITDDGYILKEVVELHELLHMSHYQKILNDTKIDSLVNELKKDLVYNCQFYQRYIKTPEGAAIDFESKVNQYIVKAEREYRKQSGLRWFDVFGNEHPGDQERELRNELEIQRNEFLVDLIRSYHKALAKARGTRERPNCFNCP